MWIYMHADDGAELHHDLERLRVLPVQHLRTVRLALGHLNVEDVVARLTVRGTCTLILPDQYTRHTWDMNRVKQCALLMDKEVVPLTHFLQMRERARAKQRQNNANPSALAGQPRLPVAEGQAANA